MMTYGPWFVSFDGIRRQILDEEGHHAGFQLLDGEQDELVSLARIGQAALNQALTEGVLT